jgi:hypothetical protein
VSSAKELDQQTFIAVRDEIAYVIDGEGYLSADNKERAEKLLASGVIDVEVILEKSKC